MTDELVSMDSRNIHAIAEHMIGKVKWEYATDSTEWVFVGEGEHLKTEKIQREINSFLDGNNLYLVDGRHESGIVLKEGAAQEVAAHFINMKRDIILCDLRFKKFIMFNCIGVMKRGERQS